MLPGNWLLRTILISIVFRFNNKYNFAGGIGVIDCTHVAIIAPVENEHVFVNRKNYHSINVQLVLVFYLFLYFFLNIEKF